MAHNPVLESEFKTEGKVGLASAQDIEDAIQGAVKATAAMAALPSYERKAILEKVWTQ